MTVDPATWKMLEQYKAIRTERQPMTAIGSLMAGSGVQGLDLSKLPDKSELLETQHELSLIYDQIGYLYRELHQKGMREYL